MNMTEHQIRELLRLEMRALANDIRTQARIFKGDASFALLGVAATIERKYPATYREKCEDFRERVLTARDWDLDHIGTALRCVRKVYEPGANTRGGREPDADYRDRLYAIIAKELGLSYVPREHR